MHKSSFNLVSLVVIVVLLILLSLALFPAVSNAVMQANMNAVGNRGRDIFVAITGANAERKPLGLGDIWPKNAKDIGSAAYIPDLTFSSSTDYFMTLNDHNNLGTSNHCPYIVGFDYSKLAGAGVKVYSGAGPLLPENNIWTIIQNYRNDLPEVIPVMFTRNLAAESMAAKRSGDEYREMYFDTTWKKPFSYKGAVIIRKDGSMTKVRKWRMTWRIVYMNESFDANIDEKGQLVKYPLQYLTPTHKVLPSEETFNICEQKYKAKLQDHWFFEQGTFPWLSIMIILDFFFTAVVYLLSFLIGAIFLRVSGIQFKLAGIGCLYWICHWLVFSLYHIVFVHLLVPNVPVVLVFLLLAVLIQYAICKYLTSQKENQKDCKLSVARKWVLMVPLMVVLFCVFLLLLISFFNFLSEYLSEF